MAIAAFKSTTKRVWGIGSGNESDNASIVPLQPSTPLNKGSHRRSRSVSDFSSRCFTDSPSVAGDANSRHLDSLFRQGQSANRHQSDDSESEAESTYSRHTYRSRQNAEIGASRKAALQSGQSNGTRAELRKSTTKADGNHKEILDFLSCIGDQSDSESVYTGPTSRNRRLDDFQSDTESVFTRLTAPRSGRVDHQSDSESVFTRLTSRSRRVDDRQSDSESVFSRLTRPRQSADAGPPRGRGQQNGKSKGTRAGVLRRSTSQIDLSGPPIQNRNDQSETESSYNYGGRQSVNFGAPRITTSARKKGTRQATLRKSFSQTEISNSSVAGGFRQPSREQDDTDSPPEEAFYERELDHRPGVKEASCDHPEEEKTIRAVHTQNKEPRAQELDAISLYDAMRVEMRQAVLDIRSEIEQKSVTKDLVLATQTLPGSLRINVPGESDDEESAVAAVRKDYAAKLEQSEKRAHDLWTQLAAEERRCLDLVKFVKELLPSQVGSQPKPLPPPSIMPIMGPEVEKQLVSQCLDADAQRYFDECVSISGLDIMSVNDASSCGVGYQESESAWSVKDLAMSPRKKNLGRTHEKKMALLEPLISFCAQIEQTGRCMGQSSNLPTRVTVNEDGLFLPWLKWETDSDFAFQGNDENKAGNMIGSLKSNNSSRSWALTRSKSASSRQSNHSSELQESHTFDLPPGVSGLGCVSNGDLSIFKAIDFGHLKNVGLSSSYERGQFSGHIDVEMFVLQRMWLRHRIKDGRILVCGGIRV